MNLHEILCSYEEKITYNANDLFKQRFLIHMDEVCCKMSVVEYSY
jgi:hypothetical protein